MDRLDDGVLDNVIATMETTEKYITEEVSVLDKYILQFLRELKGYRNLEKQGLSENEWGGRTISDLISRSVLIKNIHDLVEHHRNDNEIQWTGSDWILKEDIVKMINDQPTAYDVDKVVERLNIEAARGDSLVYEGANGDDYYIRAENAVEIVRSGGKCNLWIQSAE